MSLISIILSYKYLIIFPLAVAEGPFLSILLGYLVYAHYLNVYVTFFVLLSADIIPDILYYRLGRYGNTKILESKYFSNSKTSVKNLNLLRHQWLNHTKKTMFFGKLAYGLALPIIISAGVAKLPLKKFIITSLPVGIFQIVVLMFVGYHLGSSYEIAAQYVKYPAIIISVLIVIVVVVYVLSTKYFAKIIKKEEVEDTDTDKLIDPNI